MMCQQPPWGILTAVNVNTAEVVWEVPLGVSDNAPPGKQNTGRPLLGGPINTASGLIFVGATDDARFRALDAKTGKELENRACPFGADAYMGGTGACHQQHGRKFLAQPA